MLTPHSTWLFFDILREKHIYLHHHITQKLPKLLFQTNNKQKNTMASTKFVHLPTRDAFCDYLTEFSGASFPSSVNHLINPHKDPELALFSLGRSNFCAVYPKLRNDVLSYDNVLSEQGIELYNTCLEQLKNHKEEGCFQNCKPVTASDTLFTNWNMAIESGTIRSSQIVLIETNTENLKKDRPDVVGWCITASGKLRTLDQSTVDDVKKFLLKTRKKMGTLCEIENFRLNENDKYRRKLNINNVHFEATDLDVNAQHQIPIC